MAYLITPLAREAPNIFGLTNRNISRKINLEISVEEISDLIATEEKLLAHGFVKLLEEYYLPMSLTKLEHNNLIKGFFSYICATYDSTISRNKNIACYLYLYDASSAIRKRPATSLLDFGCGHGIIISALQSIQHLSMTGYDFCEEAAAAAKNSGLLVLSDQEFMENSHEFDIILSVYTFHFSISFEYLEALLRKLKVGGVLAANHHKGISLQNTIKWARSLPSNVYETTISSSPFGDILTLFRIDK